MRRFLLMLMIVIGHHISLFAQTTMGGCGIASTLTQCGGTFADPGGNANYPNNSNCTQTICPGTAGQCVTIQFTTFNLESGWDFLYVYNGNSTAAPLIGTYSGTALPAGGNITANNASGCLTLRFTSDGVINSPGWLANVICAPCGTPPPPPPGPTVASDCANAVNICTNSSFQIDPNGSGSVTEFTSGSFTNPSTNPSSGNLGCLISGELNSTWMIVNIATTGTLEFSFGADGGIGCLDWIMWPYTATTCNQIISNSLQPIRCNWNGLCETFTGIATPLPAGGDASNFEPELNVTCGQRYIICLSNYSSQTTSVPLNFFGTASVSCTTFTPITVNNATICPGASATLTAAGGLTYSWTPPTGLSATSGATVVASPATTTTYTVTGNGACGSGTATSTVTVLPANDPACVTSCTATATNTGPYCVGGTIQLNGTGGGTYSWTGPNGFTSTLQNPTLPATVAAAGVYNLSINLSGCIATATTTVVVNPVATVNANADQSICAGGIVTLAGAFGGGATSATWSAPTGTFSNSTSMSSTYTPTITTGTVTLTLTTNDPTGPCPFVTDQMVITVNPLPTVNAGIDQTVCSGTNVTLAASGATTYSWTGGVTQGTPFASPIGTNNYTVTGTTAAGCTGTDIVSITVNPIPVVSAGPDAAICTGGSTAVTASGATTYSWLPGGQTTATITVSPASTTTYTVTGTSLGCTASDAVIVTVNTNAPINAGPDVQICAGQSATIAATGGATYTWNNGLGAGTSFSVSPATTTTYTVIGTDANGCTGTDAVIVNVNPLPIVNAGIDQTVCAGTSVILTAAGASTYSWNNGVAQGVSFTPVMTQTYSVTGTTTAGCIGTDQVIVTVNPLPTPNAGIDQTVCAGTAVVLTAAGASTYSWNNGVSQGVSFTPNATQNYTVTGTTAAGCTATDQVVVTVNPLPVVIGGIDQTVCAGTAVTLSASGASTYSWNNGVAQGVAFTPAVGSVTYTVTGTSSANCISTDQVIVTVNPNPAPLINGPIEYCNGNTALLTTSQPYSTYSWSTGSSSSSINATSVNNPITVTVTDANGCQGTTPVFTVAENSIITVNSTVTICQGQTALIHGITQSTAGVYSVSNTTTQGCDSISNVTLVVNPLPAVNAGVDQSLCVGASTSLTATGAATYSWNNGITQGTTFTPAATNTYTVTGTSAQGCLNTDQVVITVNLLPVVDAGLDFEECIGELITLSGAGAVSYTWNNGVVNSIPFVPAGSTTYTVTGTDNNGCIDTDQISVVVNPLPTILAGLDQTVCVGTSVTLTAAGGAIYSWDNGVSNGVSFTPVVGSLVYTVVGTDLKGCISSDQVTVNVNPLPIINAGPDQTVCMGSTVILTASGASSYSWSNGITQGVSFTPAAGTINYTVNGTDANGCVNTDQVTVTVNPLPTINAGLDLNVCEGTAVTLSASGGSTYAWTSSVVNGVSFTPPVGTNTYTVTGTDVNNCVNSDQVSVIVDPIPTVFAGNDIVVCEGQTVTLTASGASTYTWDNGISNGAVFTPSVGTLVYTVTGTTPAGCIDTDQVSVTVNPNPIVSFIPGEALGCAPFTTSLTNTTPDSQNCIWAISNGTVITGCGTVPVTFSQPGCFDVTLTTTSTNGCTSAMTAENLICVEAPPVAGFAPSSNQLSTLNTEVQFSNLSVGATDYDWTFGVGGDNSTDENPTYTYPNDEEGQYTVTLIATSPLGCQDTATSIIQIYEELIFYVPNTFTPDNDNYNPVFQPVFTSGFDPQDYVLYIYNRWGELIFESRNAEVGWNGSYGSNGEIKMCQDGTYTWKIEFKVTRWDERRVSIGHVNLIR
jgi:gliding motility-associated-like protein